MESLAKQLLLRDAERFGYHLVQPDPIDPEATLVQMVSSDDVRLLEGVPVVLTNMLLNKQSVNLEDVEKSLPNVLRRRFRMLAAVTFLFLFWVPDSDPAREFLRHYLSEREPSLIESMKSRLSKKEKLALGANVSLDTHRLEKTYKNYVVEEFLATEANLSKKIENERQTQLLDALSELFTDKQRSIMFKILNRDQLTKSEKEYYSRVIKRRLKALRNPDLQTLASTLVGL